MQETQVQFLGWEDPLEKEMATYSSILAWKISWTQEPGRLKSMGLQRVRHDWACLLRLLLLWHVNLNKSIKNVKKKIKELYTRSGASLVKNLPATQGDPGSIPGPRRSPGEGNGYQLQYSCLENSMDRGAWWVIQSMGLQRVGHDWATNTSHNRYLFLGLLYSSTDLCMCKAWSWLL